VTSNKIFYLTGVYFQLQLPAFQLSEVLTMADEIDLANDLIANEVSRALSKIRQNSVDREGSEFCIECGDKMMPERRQLGFKLCVPCAQESERRKSLFADY
jgi:RNA polymerase-binding transcription factor DksA